MSKRIIAIILVLLSISLIGCSQDTVSNRMRDPIALSGDTAYYGAMDSALRKAACEQRHIEISGIVSADGYTTVFIGQPSSDGICFSCTFPEHSTELEAIEVGDLITVHGVCTSIIGDYLYLDGCQLSENSQTSSSTTPSAAETAPSAATSPAAEPTTTPTLPPATEPVTSPTVPPVTEPVTQPTAPSVTEPVTEPAADPTEQPSTEPTVPPTTENVPVNAEVVWIPKSGKKYHSSASCSGMKDPTQISRQEAEEKGYEPCKRCCS